MPSSGMLHHVALVRTNILKEHNCVIVLLRSVCRLLVTANVVPSSPILVTLMIGGASFLQNVISYKSHTV
jgi:hypothetical protein